jgi:Zn-dependent alcohol dehydrogenase
LVLYRVCESPFHQIEGQLKSLAKLVGGREDRFAQIFQTWVVEGGSIAVFGRGAVGLAAVMAARLIGAGPIIGATTSAMSGQSDLFRRPGGIDQGLVRGT